MTRKPPIAQDVTRLRQRLRADGTWRVWWEADAAARTAGMASVDLDAGRPTWSIRQAEKLNADRARLLAGDTPPARRRATRTVTDLIEDYRRSAKWRRLRPDTQRSYAQLMGVIGAKWGRDPVVSFDKPTMYTWLSASAEARGPTMAHRLRAMCSTLFGHAELLGWRPTASNPCAGLGKELPDETRRARVGTWAEVTALEDAAEALGLQSVADGALLSLYHGQRQADALRATAGAFKLRLVRGLDGTETQLLVWHLTRSKRSTEGEVLVHPDFAPRLAQLMADRDAAAPLIVEERTGQPYHRELWQSRWREVRAHAALAEPSVATLQFRDLRRTFGVLSRQGGSSVDDVADVLGNTAATDPALREVYMPPTLETGTRAVLAWRRPPAERKKA